MQEKASRRALCWCLPATIAKEAHAAACPSSTRVAPWTAALLQARSHGQTARLPQAVQHMLTAGRSVCRHMPAWILFYPPKLHDMSSAEGKKL